MFPKFLHLFWWIKFPEKNFGNEILISDCPYVNIAPLCPTLALASKRIICLLFKYHENSHRSDEYTYIETLISKLSVYDIDQAALGADYMDRASPVNRAEKCHENLPWAAK